MTGEGRREQILDVTHAIVDAEGFHAATPGRIADAAGVTRPVLYQQFGDLAGIFIALVDREQARAASQFAAAVNGTDAGRGNAFVRVFAGVLDAIDTAPSTWRLFLFPPEGAPPELHQRLAQSQAAVTSYLQEQIVVAYPSIADPELSARMVHASGRELLRLRLADPETWTVDRLISAVQGLTATVRAGG